MTQDPVCGTAIEASEATCQSQLDGAMYFFCGPQCKTRFDADPRLFTGAKPMAPCCGFTAGVVRHTTQRGRA